MSTHFEWLQKWFKEQCNTDWEHQYGIKIETVDNPGWSITINLKETPWEYLSFTPISVDRTEDDWYFCVLRDKNFEASCGSQTNFEEIIGVFRYWIEDSKAGIDG